MSMRVVVTGCGRSNGIGLELTRQLVERGDSVEATVRAPERAPGLAALAARHAGRIRVHALDVANDESAMWLGRQIEGAVDAIVNNAGVYDGAHDLDRIETSEIQRIYSINALGALRVTRALLPNLLAGATRKVLNLSTGMAILGEENDGRAYAYRMSKVALNMMTRTMAANLRAQGVVLCVIDPGWVQTDMGGAGALVPVEQSVRGLLGWLDRMGPSDSGEFLHFGGGKLPW
jgi:NAD(P)-dependent dehydrogenase (short-subunit alcohol dehydrogenase family)